MLSRLTRIEGCRILATDGDIGKVKDLYFDDERWVIRYLVVDTGGWLTGRQVLISPYAVKSADAVVGSIAVDLTRDRVAHSPDIDTDRPVSRQHETELSHYYGYPLYWSYTSYWPGGRVPGATVPPTADLLELEERRLADQMMQSRPADAHLRSARKVRRYRIAATDHGVGHVEDFLINDETWAIRYLIVNTHNWLPGHQVLIGVERVQAVDWVEKAVRVDQARAEVAHSAPFDPTRLPKAD